jgi:release factor glutamine methyltransferase
MSGPHPGRQTFLGLELLTGGDVLVPRGETELLGGEVLAILAASGPGTPWVIDMGCGSGNLSCAVAKAIPGARLWASDLTAACAALTRDNVRLHGLEARIQVSQGDLFAPLLDQGLEGKLDLVMMNPPYIPTSSLDRTHAALLAHEPREAFDGGPYGISILTRLLGEARPFLKPGGHLLFEFGLGQVRMIQALAARHPGYANPRYALDAAAQARVAILRAV